MIADLPSSTSDSNGAHSSREEPVAGIATERPSLSVEEEEVSSEEAPGYPTHLQANNDSRPPRSGNGNHPITLSAQQSQASTRSTTSPYSTTTETEPLRLTSTIDIESNKFFLPSNTDGSQTPRLYKRRFFGLAELTLLNFAVGWGYAAPSTISTTATHWYHISYSTLNWLSISSSLIFPLSAPLAIYILNRHGPKASMILACTVTVLGNWIIYAGARTHSFGANVAGTVIHSLAMPFILAAPTRYSRLWFDDRGRTLATALSSLAYPLGSGVGALSGAYMVKPIGPLSYDGQALIIAIIFTAAAIPAPFLPTSPPTPPSTVAAAPKLNMKASLRSLATNPTFYLQLISFSVFAGAIDTITSITNQAIAPYGFSQLDAGYSIAFLIFVGVVASLIVSPILDRTKAHLIALKIIVTLIAVGYTILPFIPKTHSVAGLYVVFAFIGAASLSVEPCVLEFQAAWTHPVSPEFSSVICWSGSRFLSGIFIIIVGDGLVLKQSREGQPVGSLFNGFIFLAAMCWVCVPLAMMTGWGPFRRSAVSKVEGND